MDAARFDRLVASFVTNRRGGLIRLLTALLLRSLLAGVFAGEGAAAKKQKQKKKKCAKAGQTAGKKKRKKCCPGLTKDSSGRCAVPGCTPVGCPPTACGSVS